ncbi:UNVERIFIED_CONTAM: hypothetical protein FKN15_052277 [Acipenser sinensis]
MLDTLTVSHPALVNAIILVLHSVASSAPATQSASISRNVSSSSYSDMPGNRRLCMYKAVDIVCKSQWQSQLQQLRAMGIQDEELILRALQATGGDIQAALELIFARGAP